MAGEANHRGNRGLAGVRAQGALVGRKIGMYRDILGMYLGIYRVQGLGLGIWGARFGVEGF